jgi:protein-tyrosine phosphatase
MIDLHCHLLPAIDDGARDLATSLAMAEMFVADGVEIVACTPHILPGVYPNTGPRIRAAVAALQAEIEKTQIPLGLTTGADVHIAPGLVDGLRSGEILSLADSRYILIEPPHHILPARFEETLFDLMIAGYVPIITHPERLSWARANYAVLQRLANQGVWMQITAGSLAGKFGRTHLYLAERMLDEGLVHIIASDAHDLKARRPDLAEGAALATKRVGDEEAHRLVSLRPRGILENVPPEALLTARQSTTAGDVCEHRATGAMLGDGDGAYGASNMPSGIRGFSRRLLERFR